MEKSAESQVGRRLVPPELDRARISRLYGLDDCEIDEVRRMWVEGKLKVEIAERVAWMDGPKRFNRMLRAAGCWEMKGERCNGGKNDLPGGAVEQAR